MRGYAVIAAAALLCAVVIALAGQIPETPYTMDFRVLRPFDTAVKALATAVAAGAVVVGAAGWAVRRSLALLTPGFAAMSAGFGATLAGLQFTTTPGFAVLGLSLNAGLQAAMVVLLIGLLRGRWPAWALLVAAPLAALIPLHVLDGRFVAALVPTFWHGELLAQVFKERTYGVAVFVSVALNLFVLTILLSLAWFDTDQGAPENASTR